MKRKILRMNVIISFVLMNLIILSACDIRILEYNPQNEIISRNLTSCDDCYENEKCWSGVKGDMKSGQQQNFIECRPIICCPYEIEVDEWKYTCAKNESIYQEYCYYNCECVSEQNETYSYSKLDMTFEDKKHLAMIDDHWYCVCNKSYNLAHSEYPVSTEVRISNGHICDYVLDMSCCKECKEWKKQINETEEFIWSY